MRNSILTLTKSPRLSLVFSSISDSSSPKSVFDFIFNDNSNAVIYDINEDFNLILNGIESSDLATSIKIKMVSNMLMVGNLTSKEKSELTKLNQNL